jgi:hypothetical protein
MVVVVADWQVAACAVLLVALALVLLDKRARCKPDELRANGEMEVGDA